MTLDDAIAALNQYRDTGRPTGGFLRAVLENNLIAAVGQADPSSLQHLEAICSHVVYQLPLQCWGSPAKVTAWSAAKRKAIEATP